MVVHWPNLPGGCINDSFWGGGEGGMLSYCRSFLRLPFNLPGRLGKIVAVAFQLGRKCCCLFRKNF